MLDITPRHLAGCLVDGLHHPTHHDEKIHDPPDTTHYSAHARQPIEQSVNHMTLIYVLADSELSVQPSSSQLLLLGLLPIALAGTVLGRWMERESEHAAWLRNRRMDAYSKLTGIHTIFTVRASLAAVEGLRYVTADDLNEVQEAESR